MTPKGADLEATDLIEVSTIESGSYVTRSITGQELIDAIPPTTIEWGDIGGTLSNQTDLNTALNGKVPTTRTLTINGVAQDLSADRSWTISTGLTVGTTPIASGTIGRVLFQGTGNVLQQSGNLFWDDAQVRFQLGTTSTRILNIRPEDTTGAYGNSVSLRGGAGNGRLDFYSTSNITQLTDNNVILTSGVTPFCNLQVGVNSINFTTLSTSRLQIVGTTGNVLVNTTTDGGFKFDVNGTARVQGNLTLTSAFQVKFANNNRWIGPSELYAGVQIYAAASGSDVIQMTAGQQVHISSAGGITTQTSSVLQVDSTTKGFLPPRMTTTQKNAIASPATGLMVYDTTLNLISVYNGTTWITL